MDADWRPLSAALLRLWRLTSTVAVAGLGLTGAAAAWMASGPVAGAAVVLVAFAVGGLAWVLQGRRHRAWSYAERDFDLMLRRGVLVRRTSVVPYGRMQFVDVAQGPLDRRYGIASVVLHTAAAATDAAIPGLLEAEAVRLRNRLAELGEASAAGL